MSDQRFIQKGFDKRLAHVVEECGEVVAAAGKTQRWGAMSVNPLLPPDEQELNLIWILRECGDLTRAIERFVQTASEEFPVVTAAYYADIKNGEDR